MFKILFVCTGNTCRSCMADALYNKHAAEAGRASDTSASSAGLFTRDGLPASSLAQKVMAEGHGLDISAHRSRKTTPEIIAEADLVIGVTREHAEILAERYPEAKYKIWSAADYIKCTKPSLYDGETDVGDPYGYAMEAYSGCASLLDSMTGKLFAIVCDLL